MSPLVPRGHRQLLPPRAWRRLAGDAGLCGGHPHPCTSRSAEGVPPAILPDLGDRSVQEASTRWGSQAPGSASTAPGFWTPRLVGALWWSGTGARGPGLAVPGGQCSWGTLRPGHRSPGQLGGAAGRPSGPHSAKGGAQIPPENSEHSGRRHEQTRLAQNHPLLSLAGGSSPRPPAQLPLPAPKDSRLGLASPQKQACGAH